MIHAMICASVPMSGAGTSSSGPMSSPISAANRRVMRSSSPALKALGSTIHAAFRAAVWQAGDSALPRHPHGERAHFIERDVLAVAQAALHRPARFVVMHAIAGEDADGAIVHLHREVHRELALAVAQDVTYAGIEVDTFCDGVGLCDRGVEGILRWRVRDRRVCHPVCGQPEGLRDSL